MNHLQGVNTLTVNMATLRNVLQTWLCSEINGQPVKITGVHLNAATPPTVKITFEDVPAEETGATRPPPSD